MTSLQAVAVDGRIACASTDACSASPWLGRLEFASALRMGRRPGLRRPLGGIAGVVRGDVLIGMCKSTVGQIRHNRRTVDGCGLTRVARDVHLAVVG